MNAQDYVSIIAQSGNGEIFQQGIHQSGHGAIGINPQLGLAVLARDGGDQLDQAGKCVEILLDDMQLNLPSQLQQSHSDNPVSACLTESLENINEYLLSRSQPGDESMRGSQVSIIAAQFQPEQYSVFAIGDLDGFLIHQDRLDNILLSAPSDDYLGKQISLQTRSAEPQLQPGSSLFFTSSSFVDAIGSDFIRITLSRFADNPDMAIRQLNTRGSHQGLSNTAEMIICQIKSSDKGSHGWFGKLRER